MILTIVIISIVIDIIVIAGIIYYVRRRRRLGITGPLFEPPPSPDFFPRLKKFISEQQRDATFWTGLEELLLEADVGVRGTERLVRELRQNTLPNASPSLDLLRKILIDLLASSVGEGSGSDGFPSFRGRTGEALVWFIVGVNGTGKTTSVAKLAAWAGARGKRCLLIAADTFRSAAAEQLGIWAERLKVPLHRAEANADPASVVYAGLERARREGVDLVLVDTAGRLHTRAPLMEQLGKMIRVCEKVLGRGPDQVLLILDATTGQNGLNQAQEFLKNVPVSGLMLTKYDGSSKGGIVLSVVQETGLPLRFIGTGEGLGDLQLFDAKAFIARLLNP